MGDAPRVALACDRLRERLRADSPDPELLSSLLPLAEFLRRRSGSVGRHLFDLLSDAALVSSDPWVFFASLLAARDPDFRARALELALDAARRRAFVVDERIAIDLAALASGPDAPLAGESELARAGELLALLALPPPRLDPDPIVALYLTAGDREIRRLAARILDLPGEPARGELRARVLGREAEIRLTPYLDYTRASHCDLLDIAGEDGAPPPCLDSLAHVAEICGERVLRETIAALGWSRINLGLAASYQIPVSVGGAFPLLLSVAETQLLEAYKPVRRMDPRILITAHGGSRLSSSAQADGSDPVGRFRGYNLAHAEILSEILSVAPLTRDRVERVLERMDRITEDFVLLFARYDEECAALPRQYAGLKQRILHELDAAAAGRPLNAELTRLVQMFEDPKSLSEVRTLHGLKRYLHQRGLRLGFKLVDSGRATNRSVDLILATHDRILLIASRILYVDFEPEEADGEGIPYPVRVVADGFGRHLLHGESKLPDVKVFCYGNEVHYYIAFGNHPAFLRIDYAPPLRGGMIDLEYYGVSKNELTEHPAPDLPAIRHFLRRLDFDATVTNTRIHARYDKERAVDLSDLCERVESLFRLVPVLMDLDWTIGSLRVSQEAQHDVAVAWCDFFLRWGVLPEGQLLTADRQGILAGIETNSAGREREVVWSGDPPYRDRFTVAAPVGFLVHVDAALRSRGIASPIPDQPESEPQIGQVSLERLLLVPLAAALARGEILETKNGFRPAAPELYEPVHEAASLARLLATDGAEGPAPEQAVRLAALTAPLERTLRFRSTGSVNGFEVQRARLALRGGWIFLHVLRDGGGIIRLAMASWDEVICRRRASVEEAWAGNLAPTPSEFAAILRRNGYLTPGLEPEGVAHAAEEIRAVRALFASPNRRGAPAPLPGERVLHGMKASPGRATGIALFGTTGRKPEDLDGGILIAPSISPEENSYIYHSAGIVSTGGGILSHAGLLAVQFRKPSLIVSGRWDRSRDASPSLLYATFDYEETEEQSGGLAISMRQNIRERQGVLREGDVVIVDADEGTLRVLGSDRDTLALHEELRQLRETGLRLAEAGSDSDLLALRGRRLRARHQLARLLARIQDAALARHAVRELLTLDLVDGPGSGAAATSGEQAELLRVLLENRAVGKVAGESALERMRDLETRLAARREEALRSFPDAEEAYEILSQRLDLLRLRGTLEGVHRLLVECGLAERPSEPIETETIDRLALERLALIIGRLCGRLDDLPEAIRAEVEIRHLLRQIERLEAVLPVPAASRATLEATRRRLAGEDQAIALKLAGRKILRPEDGGLELREMIGSKAANLAEVDRLLGSGRVPRWFVVTDAALGELLDAALGDGESTLRQAIEAILAAVETSHEQKSFLIRKLWEGIRMPQDLEGELLAAYRDLAAGDSPAGSDGPGEPGVSAVGGGAAEPFVAVRSSGCEEDLEESARAGEFATFLFVRGRESFILSLKRAWAGLWSERAIHNRAVLGLGAVGAGGGLIVQRIVRSRVAGVLQTENVGEGRLREMVINAGLGLGEGVVSGAVGADQIVVAKGGDPDEGPLRFHYLTNDKREKVIFDERLGAGTVRVETLYHERFRPALEYVEICELTSAASRLERAYGCPLDIEFAIEETQLAILQVRPVVTFAAVLRETRDQYRLGAPQIIRPDRADGGNR